MFKENIKFNYSMSDKAVLQNLGQQLKQMRLNKNITQAKLGELSGLSRITISEIENTGIGTISSFVKLLRALEKLELLNYFIEAAQVSPLQIAKLYGEKRIRASRTNIDKPK
ncbi:MAG: helix-turn-helix domain-containing protein [Elusimicrobiota bacterium]|jgi:transcriptional regulator with XRE-family HTH domain|nr:helix-turn-helix domain-containing protein [Elusimicrobiota bacterium]